MSRSVPFATRPPAQYQRPEFYWRGGDPLHEKEYLVEEHRQVMAAYRKAELELRAVERSVKEANDTLAEREGYTNALSSFLEGDVESSHMESQYKQRLAELEDEINIVENELSQVRSLQNPALAASLNKERSYLIIEIQRGQQTIQNMVNQRDEAKKQLAACTIHNKYVNAARSETKLRKVMKKKQYLRQLVNSTKASYDESPAPPLLSDPAALKERGDLQDLAPLKVSILTEEEKNKNRPIKYRREIEGLLAQIQELNERMADIGLEDKMEDLEALHSRMLPEEPGPSLDEDDFESEN